MFPTYFDLKYPGKTFQIVMTISLVALLTTIGCAPYNSLKKINPLQTTQIVAEGQSQIFEVASSSSIEDEILWTLDGDVVQVGGSSYHYIALADNKIEQHQLLASINDPDQPGNVEWRIADTIDVTPSADDNPHIPKDPGPWFEGWYTRLSDHTTGRSMAVIVASHLPDRQNYQIGRDYPGYVNVLINEGGGSPTKSYTVFPQNTRVLVEGAPVSTNPLPLSPAAFRWEADGIGYITQDTISLTLPGDVSINISTSNRIPFNQNDYSAVPEGPLAQIDLPLRWYIHSFGSDAQYDYQLIGVGAPVQNGQGYAHLEKNWGAQFPIGWIWGQGINADNSSQFVASRALVDFGAFVLDAWIVAFRSEDISWDFRFDMSGAVLTDVIDACEATASMEIIEGGRRLVLDFSAPFDTFGDVSIPTKDGFQPASGGESFAADVTISAYKNSILVAQETYSNAALELGAAFFCTQ